MLINSHRQLMKIDWKFTLFYYDRHRMLSASQLAPISSSESKRFKIIDPSSLLSSYEWEFLHY